MRVAPSKFDQIVAGKAEPALVCRYFTSKLWRDRDESLRAIGLKPIPRESWHEVDRETARQTLETALSTDLCYGTKSMSRGLAHDLAREFLAPFHWQDRFFTNSETPWDPGLSSWAFSGLTDATLDTGVIVKSGEELGGLFWIASWD